MKFIADLILVFLGALIFWLSWNYIAPTLFSFLSEAWLHLSYLEAFCLLFVVRTLTVIVRDPGPKIPGDLKEPNGNPK